jgi:drug/metabolite transporter (DMT)-like permease
MVFMREVFLAIDMPSVQAALLRLAAGIAAIPLIIAIRRHPFWPRLSTRQWSILVISTLVGTLLAIWFQQLAVKRLEAGVVQTLIATCAIMAFSIDRIRGHKASGKAWLGMGVALVGVGLIALTQ